MSGWHLSRMQRRQLCHSLALRNANRDMGDPAQFITLFQLATRPLPGFAEQAPNDVEKVFALDERKCPEATRRGISPSLAEERAIAAFFADALNETLHI